MKRAYILAVAVLSFAFFSVDTARAQSTHSGTDHNDDLVLWVLSIPDGFYLDRTAPNSYMKNHKGNLAIAAGANVRMVTTLDFAGIINSSYDKGFAVPYIPNDPVGLSRSQAIMSSGTSLMYVRGVGMLSNGRKIEGYLSINFMGVNNSPQLYQAYVKLYNFTVGKTWNIISDINCAPPTIDYWSPSGFTGMRNTQARYENWITDRISYGVSLEFPMVMAEYDASTHPIAQSIPDASGYIQYNWGDMDDMNNMSSVRLSAIYRSMWYYNNIDEKSQSENGYGVQISGKAKVLYKLTAYYRALAGYGISSYINDLTLVNADLVPYNNYAGKLSNLGAYGWYAGLKYDITDDIFVSGTYSQARIYTRSSIGDPLPNAYQYSQYIVANCFWHATENLTLAAEVLRGTKTNFNSEDHSANRLNILVQYNF